MADKNMLDLLNPKLKNKKGDSINNINIHSGNEASSSINPINYNQIQFNNELNQTINNTIDNNSNNNNNNIFENQDDNDVLNLWSSTNFFFDPLDTTELNILQQNNNNVDNASNPSNIDNQDGVSNILPMSERERDRQRYYKLKKRIYSHRAKRSEDENNNDSLNENFINNTNQRNDLINLNGLQQLLANNNNNNSNNNSSTSYSIGNDFLKIPANDTNTTYSIDASSSFIPAITNNNHNNSNSNSNSSNPHNSIYSTENINALSKNKNEKGKNNNLYTQILNSININQSENSSGSGNSGFYNEKPSIRLNDSRSKEIADKKKRRSAATMRCREKKRNQLQKKEQYIGYLKNQVLFLDGLISHMGNEINWLRKSYITQYGEQSLKEVYKKNGRNIDLNVFPGSISLPIAQSTILNAQQSSSSYLNSSPILPTSSPSNTATTTTPSSSSSSFPVNHEDQDNTLKMASILQSFTNKTNNLPSSNAHLSNPNQSTANALSQQALPLDSLSNLNANAFTSTPEVEDDVEAELEADISPVISQTPISAKVATSSSLPLSSRSSQPLQPLQPSQPLQPLQPLQPKTKSQIQIPNFNTINTLINLPPEQREILIKLLKKPDLALKLTSTLANSSGVGTSSSTTTTTMNSALPSATSIPPSLSLPLTSTETTENMSNTTTTTTTASTTTTSLGSLTQNILNSFPSHENSSNIHFTNTTSTLTKTTTSSGTGTGTTNGTEITTKTNTTGGTSTNNGETINSSQNLSEITTNTIPTSKQNNTNTNLEDMIYYI